MGVLGRLTGRLRRRGQTSGASGAEPGSTRDATRAHFSDFVATRTGVEAYIEPATANDPVTMVLIATTGEWTRRRVPDTRAGFALARELGVPAYDVLRTGYPPRMRRWNSRNRHR